jgi:hypothetical protein
VFLDDALKTLAERAPRKAKVVELRFFGGLSVDETAQVLHVSSITVMREWNTAKVWLYRELTGRAGNDAERWTHVDKLPQSALELPTERDLFLGRAVVAIIDNYLPPALNAGSRHGNPIQVALHALAREGVCINSPAGHHIR